MSGTKIEWVVQILSNGRDAFYDVLWNQTEAWARRSFNDHPKAYHEKERRIIKRTTVTTEEVIK